MRIDPTDARWTVRSRATGNKSSHQVTIPAAIAAQLPTHVAWELTVTPEGLLYRYLGAVEAMPKQPVCVPVPWLDGDAA